jgi:FkbM family methyltransferase
MYYSAAMLRSLAARNYVPGPTVRLENFSLDDAQPEADLIADGTGTIMVHIIGQGRLHFHKHAWSGCVSVFEGGRLTEANLYSVGPEEHWIPFGAGPGEATSVVILPLGERDPASQGGQVWLRGIEFFEPQMWQASAFPLSRFADFRHGRVGSLVVPHHDAVIGKAIMKTGAWAPKDLDLFKQLVTPGDVVFDVGANIGHHTVFFSDLVGPDGRVFALEPQLEIFRFASANLALNGCRNTVLLQGCLGSENGEARMAAISYEEANNFGALSVASDKDMANGETVPVWTLDHLVASGTIPIGRLDFMKIDVQSFELYVIQGAEQTIGRFKPKIFIEIAPHWMKLKGYDYADVYAFLKRHGYQFQHFAEGAGIEDGIRKWSGQIAEEWDVLCIPPA